MNEYVPPTQEEIARVAEYWNRVKFLACQHPSMTFDSIHPDRPKCGACDRPLHILSDFQLDEMRLHAP